MKLEVKDARGMEIRVMVPREIYRLRTCHALPRYLGALEDHPCWRFQVSWTESIGYTRNLEQPATHFVSIMDQKG